jgi:polyhydroxyalkanoate synthase subunit PhaC
VLARRGDAGRIASATLLTAQVDFSEPGDLGHFADPATIEAAGRLAQDGCLDGRYLAATFNLLRGRDLIWNYVERNYLLGEDYPAFDLLFWNGDSTNLPAGWLQDYLRDLYIGNRLVDPDALSACGQPIDLTRIATPCFVHAAREDHIAPPQSVWKATRHFSGPVTFLLAGSGHIAGVVNPPAAGRYGYWTHDRPAETFEDFLSGAEQHPGSWWPYWLQWLESVDRARVAARGKRRPGGRGDTVLEDAPGSYVRER